MSIVIRGSTDALKRKIILPRPQSDAYADLTDGTGIKASVMHPDGTEITTTADIVIETDGHTHVTLTEVEAGAVANDGMGSACIPYAAGRLFSGNVPVTFMSVNPYAARLTLDEIADALLLRDWSDIDETGHEEERNLLNAARLLRNKRTAAGGVMTVKKEEDLTDAWQANFDGSAAVSNVEPDPL
jgi:hypothetical protein